MFYFQAGTVSSITSAGAPDFSTLPMAALVCIMQHVPLRSRMGSSSRVCTAWTDAAAAATTTFDLELCSNHSSLAKFLWKHGRMVTSMELRSSPGLAQLPCPKLLRLSIQQCSLHLSPGSQLARDIASATQLSSIQLNQVVFKGEEPDLASVLGALPNLQELTLHNLQGPTFALYPAVLSILQQLPGGGQMLTRLELQADDSDASFKQPATLTAAARAACRLHLFQSMLRAVGSLPSLQHLGLEAPGGIRAEALDRWRPPPGLTALHLGGLVCSVDAWPVAAGHPASLAEAPGRGYSGLALRHLSLSWLTAGHTLGVQHLAGWSQLQSLKLSSVGLRGTPAQGVELLCVLPHLEQLTALVLDGVSFAQGANPACFSALLSHSKLQHLEVTNTSLPWRDMTAPFAASQAETVAGGGLPRCLLQSLHLNLDNPSLAAAVSARDVEALLACCTGLRALHIRSSTGFGQTYSSSSFGSFGGPSFLPALHALQHLTSLATSGVDDLTVWSLVRLTGLRELRVLAPSDLTDAGLKALTSLQKLTALDLCPCWFSGALFKAILGAATMRNQPGEQALWRISTTGTWTMPDVWQQLQAITSRPPARTATSLKPLKGPQAAANSNSRRRVRRPAEQQLSCSPRLAFGTQLLEAPGPGFPLHYLDAKASQRTTAHCSLATNQPERPPSPDTARQLEHEPLLSGPIHQLGIDGCQGELQEGNPGCLPGVQRVFVRVATAVRRGSVRLQQLLHGGV